MQNLWREYQPPLQPMQQKQGVLYTTNNIRAAQAVNTSILLSTLSTSLSRQPAFALRAISVALCQYFTD